jgi:hypothetical protein
VLAVAAILGGCDVYPPASEVAACAAARFGTERGAFSTSRRSADEEVVVYAKRDSPDRAIVVYRRDRGAVNSHQNISFGNHAEIQGAIEAIRYCAQPGDRAKTGPGP